MLKKPETDRIFIGAFIMSRDFISFHAFRLVNRTENPMTQEQLVSSEKDLIFTDQVITYKISLDSIQYAPNHESLDFF